MVNNYTNKRHQKSNIPPKKYRSSSEDKTESVKEKDSDVIEFEGIIDDILGFGNYSVLLNDVGMKVIAYASWKMNKNNISIIQWDKVRVELNPLDPTKWRIVYRQK